ncbi:DNA-binding protein [Flavobacterium sp.]|uniref:DNA-binding protein n=1 Tax=Flavobacterium sp. TaxID=239 RepID=UPI0035B2B38F
MLVQLTANDLILLIKEAVKEELQKITNVIKLNPKEKESEPELLTRKQTAELLNVSETTLFLWNRDKVLEHKKLNNRVYYIKNEVLNKLKTVA